MSCRFESSITDHSYVNEMEDDAYVLPPKTRLNSSVYLDTNDSKSKYIDNNSQMITRKLCNDVNIPTYKGFSTVKHEYHKPSVKKKFDKITLSSSKDIKNRKVVKVEYTENKLKNEIKRSKLKENMRTVETAKIKTSKPKVVESFWNKNHKKPHIVNEGVNLMNTKKPNEKSYDREKIQNLIRNNKEKKKKEEQAKQEAKIKEDLRRRRNMESLNQNIRNHSNCAPKPSNSIQRNIKPLEPNKENIIPSDNVSEVSNSSSNINRMINDWDALHDREMINYMLPDQYDYDNMSIEASRLVEHLTKTTQKMAQIRMDISSEIKKKKSKRTTREILTSISPSSSRRSSIRDKSYSDHGNSPFENITPQLIGNRARMKLDDLFGNSDIETNSSQESIYYEKRIKIMTKEIEERYYGNQGDNRHLFYNEPDHRIRSSTVSRKMSISKEMNRSDRKLDLYSDSLAFHIVHKQKKQLLLNRSTIETKEATIPSRTVEDAISYSNTFNSAGSYSDKLLEKVRTINTSSGKSISLEERPLSRQLSDISTQQEFEYSSQDDEEEVDTESYGVSSPTKLRLLQEIPPMRMLDSKARLSPRSLEAQLLAGIHHNDALDTGYNYLIESDRMQGISAAQQETVSLAQLYKAQKSATTAATNTSFVGNNNYSNVPQTQAVQPSAVLTNELKDYLDRLVKKAVKSKIKKKHVRRYSSSSASSSSSRSASPVNTYTTTSTSTRSQDKKNKKQSPKLIRCDNTIPKPKTKSPVKKLTPSASPISEVIEEVIDVNSESKSSGRPVDNSEIAEEISTKVESSSSASSKLSTGRTDKSIEELVQVVSDDERKSSVATNQSSIKENIPSLSQSSGSVIVEELPTELSQHNTNATSDAKSSIDYDNESFEASTSKHNLTNFDDTVIGPELNEIQMKISSLEKEKIEKQRLYNKLKNRMKYTHFVHQEKSLREHVELLDHKIKMLNEQQAEISQSHSESLNNSLLTDEIFLQHNKKIKPPVSTTKNAVQNKDRQSSISSSSSINKTTAAKSLSRKSTSCKTSSSSSSDATLSKDNDIKTEMSIGLNDYNKSSKSSKSVDYSQSSSSSSSSTTVTSTRKEECTPQTDRKPEEIDTPRSVKQLQFGEINEEYSASEHEDHHKISQSDAGDVILSEVAISGKIDEVSGAVSSRYHILELDGGNIGGVDAAMSKPDNVNLDDSNVLLSARTIHSEISEIPDECDLDLSQNEDEEANKLSSKTEVSYSMEFTEPSELKSRSVADAVVVKEEEEIEEDLSYNPTISEYSISVSVSGNAPEVPPRKQEMELEQMVNRSLNQLQDELLLEYSEEALLHPPVVVLHECKPDEIDEDEEDDDEEEEEEEEVSYIENRDEALDPTLQLELVRRSILRASYLLKPYVETAVKFLFHLHKTKPGGLTTSEYFDYVINSHFNTNFIKEQSFGDVPEIPEIFMKENSDIHCKELLKTISESVNASEKLPSKELCHQLIDRRQLLFLIKEIFEQIFQLENLSKNSTPWRHIHDDALLSAMKLWGSSSMPSSESEILNIVNRELIDMGVILNQYGEKLRKPIVRSKLHQWFRNKTEDPVDHLMIDDVMRQERRWKTFGQTCLQVIDNLSNQIADNLVMQELELVNEQITALQNEMN